jgi:broad specificity phosphatase PhoE
MSWSSENDPIFEITFLRHGESVGNFENRMQGQMDYPLTPLGQKQAQALADRWLRTGTVFDFVISSPLGRASETAQILAKNLNLPELEYDPIWMERDMGVFSGQTFKEVKLSKKKLNHPNPFSSSDESRESDWSLYLRACAALHNLLLKPPGKYLVVTHGALMNMLLLSIMGISPQSNNESPRFILQNTSFASFLYFPMQHKWRVNVIGDCSHIESLQP